MSQRDGAKTGRRKKKVKSSSLSTTKTPGTTTGETSETDGTKSEESTLTISEKPENIEETIPPEPEPEPEQDNFIEIPESFFLVEAPKFADIDGVQVKSALFSSKKWPLRTVNFPTRNENIVTGYHEPANPWRHAEDVDRDILISSYKKSCERHCTEPLKIVIEQLEKMDIDNGRCDEFSLKNENLEKIVCEPLEEIFKRIQFKKIDLEAANLDDESAETLFDMIEYYESTKYINISANCDIGARGWQSCAQMMKKTLCLEQLDAKDIVLTQQHMNILKRPLQFVSHLQILKFENCGLAGRAFVILISALKMNTGIKELHLADNGFDMQDAIHIGSLLRANNSVQLLDISNNKVKDDGVKHILDAVISQSTEERKANQGLRILVLWNNHLTKNSAGYFAEAIAQSNTLETINIGQNILTDEVLEICKEALKKNTSLVQLGLQSTGLLINGILALSEVMETNETLQRIDLRDNNIQLTGLTFLALALKKNTTVTQIDLDDKTWSKSPPLIEQYAELVTDIRSYCSRNDEPSSTDESSEDTSSSQNRSRLSSVNSRKISLTCQTLPRSPPALSNAEVTSRTTMLEPKRTTGGRLRSPAPSPIPSPVASPIPSPSRSRFVVSRVSEASLSSTNSSASSSPVTPPSLSSPTTCFFPSTIRKSRFRVTVIEPNPPTSESLSSNNIVNCQEKNNSDDSDSVFLNSNSRLESESSVENDLSLDENIKSSDTGSVFENTPQTPVNSFSSYCPQSLEINNKTSVIIDKVPLSLFEVNDEVCNEKKKDLSPKIVEVPKQTSSLERLLGLFHHPGSLFTGTFSSSIENKNEVKTSLQGGVNSMMALGDKFQQYLRQETTTAQPVSLQRSASDDSRKTDKNDPTKSLSNSHISNIQETNDHQHLQIEKSEKVIKIEESVDDSQEGIISNLKVLKIQENQENIDRINLLLPDEKISSKIAQNDNKKVSESCVPVLKFTSELSVMIGSSETCIDEKKTNEFVVDIESCRDKNVCDSSTKDSINVCNFKSVECDIDNVKKIIVNKSDNDESADDVHKFFNLNDSNNLLMNYHSNNNDRNHSFIKNNNQGNEFDHDNAQYQLSIENDVKDIMSSILNDIPGIVDCEDFTEMPVECHHNIGENSFDFQADNVLNSNTSNAKMTSDSLSVNSTVNNALCENISDKKLKNNDDNLMNSVSIIYQNCTGEASSINEEFLEPQTSRSPTNLLIEKSKNIHRNSQDSGIEETNTLIADDHFAEISRNLQPRNSFQESVDSGFDLECCSMYNRVENVAETAKEINIPEINVDESQDRKNTILKDSEILKDLQSLDDGNIQMNDEQISSSYMRVD